MTAAGSSEAVASASAAVVESVVDSGSTGVIDESTAAVVVEGTTVRSEGSDAAVAGLVGMATVVMVNCAREGRGRER